MRFREELRAGRDPAQATDAAMATPGLAVVLSADGDRVGVGDLPHQHAGVVVHGDGGDPGDRGRGLDLGHVDPAVLATFGRSAAKRSSVLRWSWRGETTQSRFWTRWVRSVMKRPWLSASRRRFLLMLAAPAF